MALTREQKETFVAKLEDIIKDAKTVIFANFHGLSVADADELRGMLREQGTTYTVVKKTLLTRALEGVKMKGDVPTLEGEVAIAYGDDPLAPASGVATFAKNHKEQIAILGGIYEGRFEDREFMEDIASIPPLLTLRGMFVNVINSPIQGLAVALSQIAEKRA